jgi:RHS repeat-associated protein
MVTDVSGNIATQVVNFTVQTVTNRSEFTYDANGNMSSAGVSPAVVYQYDAENRLVRATSNSVVVLECWYDGVGRRLAKREIIGTQTNAVQYVWDGWQLVAVLGEDGQLKEYYTRGVGIAGDIGTLVAVTHYTGGSPSATYYLHNNYRGDVILARQDTNTVATLDYAPYGELRSQGGSYAPRFRFSSKEYDAGTGFYYFPYRYYAPMWARWMTRDPLYDSREANLIRFRAGANLSSYVGDNPVKHIDPRGLDCAALEDCYTGCDDLWWWVSRVACRHECRRLIHCNEIFEGCGRCRNTVDCQQCCDRACWSATRGAFVLDCQTECYDHCTPHA